MSGDARKRVIQLYTTEEGEKPFEEWFYGIKDRQLKGRIARHVDRIKNGNLGDHKAVGEGVLEKRLFFGSGYRIYFAEYGEIIVVLLLGGDKSTQGKDIKAAKAYWNNYKERMP
ncbi:MAG: type II toxin-antitoxin system RelE/ParE family toxin [Rhodothermaceae bacterium]|nr:type II toxin-antitoxin system RelE/ParE family toxin [Rhodothermaceae bacterium]